LVVPFYIAAKVVAVVIPDFLKGVTGAAWAVTVAGLDTLRLERI